MRTRIAWIALQRTDLRYDILVCVCACISSGCLPTPLCLPDSTFANCCILFLTACICFVKSRWGCTFLFSWSWTARRDHTGSWPVSDAGKPLFVCITCIHAELRHALCAHCPLTLVTVSCKSNKCGLLAGLHLAKLTVLFHVQPLPIPASSSSSAGRSMLWSLKASNGLTAETPQLLKQPSSLGAWNASDLTEASP